jgi:hypothetical protein
MDSQDVAKSMRGSIGMLAMHWLLAPSTTEQAVEAGMPDGIAGYAVGRLGVLGDCPVDNVVAAAFFWDPGFLAKQTVKGRAQFDPKDGAAIYAKICQQWGEDHLKGFDGVERLGELAEWVVNNASPLGAPLFVGWRDQTLPEPGAGRTMQLCQTLRELGFSRFCSAMLGSHLSPLEAIMSGPTGVWNAELFGWEAPFPDGEPHQDLRKELEVHANTLHAPDFEVLSPEEREEFVALCKQARNHATSLMTEGSSAMMPGK